MHHRDVWLSHNRVGTGRVITSGKTVGLQLYRALSPFLSLCIVFEINGARSTHCQNVGRIGISVQNQFDADQISFRAAALLSARRPRTSYTSARSAKEEKSSVRSAAAR